MIAQGLLERAHARAQRRLHVMVERRTFSDWSARETRLYVQAERLVDSLLVEADWERSKAELDHLQTIDHDWHISNAVIVAECDDCMGGWTIGELVEAWGK